MSDINKVDLRKIAYSKYFKANIRCVDYKSDTDWTFMVLPLGKSKSDIILKAQSNYNDFKWQ